MSSLSSIGSFVSRLGLTFRSKPPPAVTTTGGSYLPPTSIIAYSDLYDGDKPRVSPPSDVSKESDRRTLISPTSSSWGVPSESERDEILAKASAVSEASWARALKGADDAGLSVQRETVNSSTLDILEQKRFREKWEAHTEASTLVIFLRRVCETVVGSAELSNELESLIANTLKLDAEAKKGTLNQEDGHPADRFRLQMMLLGEARRQESSRGKRVRRLNIG